MTDRGPVTGLVNVHGPGLPAVKFVPARSALRRFGGLLALLLLGAPVLDSQAPPTELEVKAAFVLNFLRFVSWKPIAGEQTGQLPVCALAKSDFASAVEHLVEGKVVQGRTVVFRLDPDPEPDRCRALIVDASHYENAYPALARIAQDPVLTVGNGPGLVDMGGMFDLVVENRKVRFDSSLVAIHKSRLHVPANLLQLSRHVTRK